MDFRRAMTIAMAMGLSGCGSIVRGTDEPVAFVSDPAGARMTTNKGYACPQTPCTLQVARSDEFEATFEKAGFRPVTVPVRTEIVGKGGAAVAGNILAGGVIGLGVDAATGAAYDHTPNPVSVTLEADHPAVVSRPRRTKKRAAPET